jgi:hypothetical protein
LGKFHSDDARDVCARGTSSTLASSWRCSVRNKPYLLTTLLVENMTALLPRLMAKLVAYDVPFKYGGISGGNTVPITVYCKDDNDYADIKRVIAIELNFIP